MQAAGEELVVRGSSSKCQDCGNQAKRECSYGRCRSCCKNKGFECQTHLKSTWIPVERRRQREREEEQQQQSPPPTAVNPHHFQGDNIPKKHKQKKNTYSGTDREFKFPAATSSMAVFRCVQVRSTDNTTVNEMAYQTSVNIGGHVFSGILYDQGPDQQNFYTSRGGDSSTTTATGLVDQTQNLSLINASMHTRDGATMASLPASNYAHDDDQAFLPPPPPPYPYFPLAAPFRPGMPYFPHPKP